MTIEHPQSVFIDQVHFDNCGTIYIDKTIDYFSISNTKFINYDNAVFYLYDCKSKMENLSLDNTWDPSTKVHGSHFTKYSRTYWKLDKGSSFVHVAGSKSTILISKCKFITLVNNKQGGAISIDSAKQVMIKDSLFQNCESKKGGALFIGQVLDATLSNNIFNRNSAVRVDHD